MRWGDARIFLALYRAGSVRAAALQLGTSHSTIARRFEAFESNLGVKIMERQGSAYVLSDSGVELLHSAEKIENEFFALKRKLIGKDNRLAGSIRITIIDVYASHLLMPDIQEFMNKYPDIQIELNVSYQALDISKREADIAIRTLSIPPSDLIGRKLCSIYDTAYSTAKYVENHDLKNPKSACWIGFGSVSRYPKWVRESDFPHLACKGIFDSMLLQLHAAQAGMGIAYLPCFLGDQDNKLIRISPNNLRTSKDLWILRHKDTRSTARLKIFTEFIVSAINKHKDLLEGRKPQNTN